MTRLYSGILCALLLALPTHRPPAIYGTFTSHSNGQTVTSSAINIGWKGCSNATQTVYQTYINGVSRATTQSAGIQCPDYSIGKSYSASGTLTLGANALHLHICDSASNCSDSTITVYYRVPAVSVTPDGGTAPAVMHGAAGSYDFTVTNTGGVTATASFSSSCTGAVTSCSASPSSAEVSAGHPATVTVSYTGSTVGTGVASLTATYVEYPGVGDGGSVNVSVTPNPVYAVSVVPVNPSQTVTVGPALVYFDVTNTSQDVSTASTFALTPTVSGTVSACSLSPGSVTLAPGDPAARVTASCTITGSESTGSVRLDASTSSPASFSGNGTTNVTVTSSATLSVGMTGRNPGTTIDRADCLTIAAGQNAAYECGDLRVVHPLPATVTMDKARAPSLIYNSRHANPSALLAADVTYNGPTPAILRATVTVPGQSNIVHDFTWSSACAAVACRIAVPISTTQPTGLYPATLQITAINGPYFYATSAAVTDTVVIVNRAASPFGAGWWLDGFESLVTVSADRMLWIGGDGSTRLYNRTGDPTVYTVSPAYDRPDTLKQVASSWRRLLGDSAYVEFNSAGQHTRTVSALGWVTRFVYSGALLDSLVLPVPSGSAQIRAYKFLYTSSLLDSVRAPMASFARTVRVARGGTSRINSITDPDGLATAFGYDGSNRIITRVNKLADSTFFQYDDGGALKQAKLSTARTDGAGSAITTNFRAAETRSVFSSSDVMTPLGGIYTQLDGPRIDVGDTTNFLVNRWGASDTVINALGQRTRMFRANATFPALVTSVIAPNGFETRAYFNARALADSTVAVNPYGTGANAVTKFVWNPVWVHVDSVIGPTGDRTRTFYQSAKPLVDSVRSGTNVARRVKFRYTADGQIQSVTEAGGLPDSVLYDMLGNAIKTWTPLGRSASTPYFTQYFKDAIGRDTLMVHPISGDTTGSTRILFDAADRVIQTVESGPARPYSLPISLFTPDTATISALVKTDTSGYDAEGNLTYKRSRSTPWSDAEVTDRLAYDAAGRLRSRDIGSGLDSLVYDPAGNLITARYRSGLWVTQSYDAVNRVAQRVVPERKYPSQRCTGYSPGPISGYPDSYCMMIFPYYPNAGDSLKIAADTSRFVYDAVAGNMLQANNRYARVRRTYYSSGALKTDTTAIGRVSAPLTDSLTRGQQYVYDLAGRRTSMQWLLGTNGYNYTDFGALSTVTDPGSNQYRFVYTLDGQVDSLLLGTGVKENRDYDGDGRLTYKDRISTYGSLGTLGTDTFDYDRMNRIIHSVEQNHAQLADETRVSYDGLGGVLATEQSNAYGANVEEFRNDPLGNVLYRKTRRTAGTNDAPFTFEYSPRGELLTSFSHLSNPSGQNELADTLKQTFIGQQLIKEDRIERDPDDGTYTLELATRHYYGADDKLMAVQRYSYRSPTLEDGTWEEYWYDALGRRVLTRARRPESSIYDWNISGPLCLDGIQCRSFTERVWWDGDQALVEQRSPEGTSDVSNSGTIGNVHGLTLDEPLAVIADQTRIVNYNWRGLGESSVFPNGAAGDASLGNNATEIDWSALTQAQTYFTPGPGSGGSGNPKRWLGTFVANGQSTTGMLYRRNRYFNPVSGQFTQADPIGIAGGMNAFGFAGGDPVNYSDPFGLCPRDMGGDGKTKTLSDCPQNSEGRRRFASGAVESAGWLDPMFFIGGLEANEAKEGAATLGGVIARGHAFVKHVLERGEFQGLGIRTVKQLGKLVDEIVEKASGPDVKALSRGRKAYWDNETGTVVIRDPRSSDLGTVLRPRGGRAWFENLK